MNIMMKNKNILCVMLVMFMVCYIMPIYADDTGNLEISASKVSGNRTNQVNVDVKLNHKTNAPFDLANASFILGYNTNALEVIEIKTNPNNDLDLLNLEYDQVQITSGKIVVNGSGMMTNDLVLQKEITYPVTLASIKFKIKSDAAFGAHSLEFIISQAVRVIKNAENQQESVKMRPVQKNGTVTVIDPNQGTKPGSGGSTGDASKYLPSPTPTPSESPTPSPTPTITPTPTKGAADFVDLAGHEWAVEAIDALVKAGIVNGTTDTTYEPARSITRAEFCKLIVTAFKFTGMDETKSFTDVAQSDWFYNFVMSASKAGVVTGYVEGDFRPNASITREEMAAMLIRAFKTAGIDVEQGELTFNDANEMGEWSKEFIAALAKMGIVSGRGDNMFVPKANLTRAESAKVIYSALNRISKD